MTGAFTMIETKGAALGPGLEERINKYEHIDIFGGKEDYAL